MDKLTTRKPMLLLRLSGLFLLRDEARAFSVLLIQEPPRNTPARCRGTRPENRKGQYIKKFAPPLRGGNGFIPYRFKKKEFISDQGFRDQ